MTRYLKINPYEKYGNEEEVILRMAKYNISESDYHCVRTLVENNNIHWDKVIGILIMNRLVGVAYKNLKKCTILPMEIERVFKAICEMQGQSVHAQMAEIAMIGNEFERRNLNYCFLKGAVLNSIVYGLGERVSNDTDILVEEKDLDKFVETLETLGYVQGDLHNGEIVPATKREKIFARMNTYEVVPFHKVTQNKFMPIHSVDVNFKLSNEYCGTSASELLKKSLLIRKDNFRLRTMEIEKFIIFLCVHLYREAIMVYKIMQGKDLTLYKFMDIHFVFGKYKDIIDTNKLYTITEKMGRQKDVFFSLYFTEKLFPGTFEEKILAMFKPVNIAYLDQYKGRDNSEEIYTWKTEFEQRVFSNTRIEEARKNIEEEENRRKKIMDMLGETK